MAKKTKSRNKDTITRPLTAAVMMFGLIVYNLATRFTHLVDTAPGIVLLTTAAILAAAGSLLWLFLQKNLKSSRRQILYLLLAFAETAVLVAFLYGVEGK